MRQSLLHLVHFSQIRLLVGIGWARVPARASFIEIDGGGIAGGAGPGADKDVNPRFPDNRARFAFPERAKQKCKIGG